jgi:Kef-type K+ transport system membrane component KefB
MAFLVPFFFVVTGAQVNLGELASGSAIGMLVFVTLLAVVSKLIGGGLGAISLGRQSALIVGVGMVPRGEVGIIVASLGQQAGVFSGRIYAIIIAMSLLTSVIAPPVLKMLIANAPPEPEDADAPDNHELSGDAHDYLVKVDEAGYSGKPAS